MTDQTYQKWFAVFQAADFSLKDSPKSGRPVQFITIKLRHYLSTVNATLLRR